MGRIEGVGSSPLALADFVGLDTLGAICGVLWDEYRERRFAEPPLLRKWEEQLAGYVRASFRATSLMAVAGQTGTFIQKVTTVAVMWLGAYRVIEGDLTIGQLIAFTMLSAQVTGPLLRLVNLWQELQQVGISVQRLGDILNTQPEPAYSPNRTTLPQVAGQVVFDDVTFRYRPDGTDVLRKVSFSVMPGCST